MRLEWDEKGGKQSQLGSCYNGPAESLGGGSGHGERELELGEGESTGFRTRWHEQGGRY